MYVVRRPCYLMGMATRWERVEGSLFEARGRSISQGWLGRKEENMLSKNWEE